MSAIPFPGNHPAPQRIMAPVPEQMSADPTSWMAEFVGPDSRHGFHGVEMFLGGKWNKAARNLARACAGIGASINFKLWDDPSRQHWPEGVVAPTGEWAMAFYDKIIEQTAGLGGRSVDYGIDLSEWFRHICEALDPMYAPSLDQFREQCTGWAETIGKKFIAAGIMAGGRHRPWEDEPWFGNLLIVDAGVPEMNSYPVKLAAAAALSEKLGLPVMMGHRVRMISATPGGDRNWTETGTIDAIEDSLAVGVGNTYGNLRPNGDHDKGTVAYPHPALIKATLAGEVLPPASGLAQEFYDAVSKVIAVRRQDGIKGEIAKALRADLKAKAMKKFEKIVAAIVTVP